MSTAGATDRRVLVCIPTYDEAENLPLILARLWAQAVDCDVLVIDDASPDGTGRIAEDLRREQPRLHVLHRQDKDGLGAAYRAGFAWALAHGYDVVVEMDADGSHAPEQLGELVATVDQGQDLALGSRWVPGGEVVDWPRSRELLSRAGNAYVRLALGVPVRDATGGYRAYSARVLESLSLRAVASTGYCFQVDMLWRAVCAGFSVVEVPISFVERQHGSSKMDGRIVLEALMRVTWWGLRRVRPARTIPARVAPVGSVARQTSLLRHRATSEAKGSEQAL